MCLLDTEPYFSQLHLSMCHLLAGQFRRAPNALEIPRPASTAAAVAAPEAPVTSTSEPDEVVLKLYKRLQNGSDVRGIAVDGEPTALPQALQQDWILPGI